MKLFAICEIVEFNHLCKHFLKLNNIYNKLNMNLDVHLMVVLIIFYQIIQLLQMEKKIDQNFMLNMMH